MLDAAVIGIVTRLHDRDSFRPANRAIHRIFRPILHLKNGGIAISKLPQSYIIVGPDFFKFLILAGEEESHHLMKFLEMIVHTL